MDQAQDDAVRFHNVEFSAENITLFSQQSKILSVAKKDVRKVTLKYGFQSERPIFEVIFGGLVIVLGLYFFLNFILKAIFYQIVFIKETLSLFLLPVGGWFMVDGFRKRFYFEVTL
jgi:hypothetical protein